MGKATIRATVSTRRLIEREPDGMGASRWAEIDEPAF